LLELESSVKVRRLYIGHHDSGNHRESYLFL